jgi:DNA-binding NarL/FixJ family response regulator
VSQNEQIVKLYRDGWKPVEIARAVGTTEWTVHHRLNRNDVERRPIGMTPEQTARALRFYKQGLSMRQISLKIGFNDKTIRKALDEAGVEIRPSARHPRH